MLMLIELNTIDPASNLLTLFQLLQDQIINPMSSKEKQQFKISTQQQGGGCSFFLYAETVAIKMVNLAQIYEEIDARISSRRFKQLIAVFLPFVEGELASLQYCLSCQKLISTIPKDQLEAIIKMAEEINNAKPVHLIQDINQIRNTLNECYKIFKVLYQQAKSNCSHKKSKQNSIQVQEIERKLFRLKNRDNNWEVLFILGENKKTQIQNLKRLYQSCSDRKPACLFFKNLAEVFTKIFCFQQSLRPYKNHIPIFLSTYLFKMLIETFLSLVKNVKTYCKNCKKSVQNSCLKENQLQAIGLATDNPGYPLTKFGDLSIIKMAYNSLGETFRNLFECGKAGSLACADNHEETNALILQIIENCLAKKYVINFKRGRSEEEKKLNSRDKSNRSIPKIQDQKSQCNLQGELIEYLAFFQYHNQQVKDKESNYLININYYYKIAVHIFGRIYRHRDQRFCNNCLLKMKSYEPKQQNANKSITNLSTQQVGNQLYNIAKLSCTRLDQMNSDIIGFLEIFQSNHSAQNQKQEDVKNFKMQQSDKKKISSQIKQTVFNRNALSDNLFAQNMENKEVKVQQESEGVEESLKIEELKDISEPKQLLEKEKKLEPQEIRSKEQIID